MNIIWFRINNGIILLFFPSLDAQTTRPWKGLGQGGVILYFTPTLIPPEAGITGH